ncbi:MAG: hypothetical protein ACREMF_03735, partial [Gemmatimonadales bacterium]
MSRHGFRVASGVAALGLAAVACFQDITSPAGCPEFCPGGQIVTIESLLATAIDRDSSFRGYVEQHEAAVMLAATLPTIDSRPVFETGTVATRLRIMTTGSDTSTGPIVVDSSQLSLTLVRRDTAAHNLRLAFYRLPVGVDSTSTFSGLAAAFAGSPVRVVNIDSLLALPGRRDSVTGDSVESVDSVRQSVRLTLKFDTLQLPFVVADSGKLALGVRVTADTLARVALGSSNGGEGPSLRWFNSVD